MIEVLKQAIDYIENVPDDRDSVGHIDRKALVLSLNQSVKEVESQELKQINVKEFVHMVEGKEDLIGRPVYFAQWPNGNTHPPQRKPLTDEQRSWIVATCPTPRHIIDTVEKMHGIKE